MRILIPTLNANPQALQLTLAAYAMTAPDVPITLITPMDTVIEWAPTTIDFHLLEENYGFAGNINAAWKEYADEDVLISNDDVVPLNMGWPRLLEEYADGLYSKQVGAVGPLTNNGLAHQLANGKKTGIEKVPTLSFFWIFIPHGVVQRVGYLDEGFGIGLGEDIDWSLRAIKEGYDLFLDKRLLVWHWGSQTLSKMTDVMQQQIKAMRYLRHKHPEMSA